MANVNIAVANPTGTDVNIGGKIAVARKVTVLSLDDATTEAEQFLAAKCALVSVSAEADLSKRTNTAFRLFRLLFRN